MADTKKSTALAAVNSSTGIMLKVIDYEHVAEQITPEQREHYVTMTRGINTDNPHSIQSYGQDVNKIIARQADDILDKTSANRMTDVVVLTNQLLSEINDIETPGQHKKGGWLTTLKSIPLLGRLVKAAQDTQIKHNTVGKNVEEISKKIESLKVVAMADNASLEQMAANTVLNVGDIQEKIVALVILKSDLEAEIAQMESDPDCNLDLLQQKRGSLNAISKRVADMTMTEFVLKQNYQQIGAMMGCNDGIIQKAEMTIGHVIPIWKQQLAIGMMMDNQRASAEVEGRMADAANKMLTQNAQALNMNSTEIARQSEENVFRLDTLKDTTRIMIDTIRQVQDIHAEGESRRNEILSEMKNLSAELAETLRNA